MSTDKDKCVENICKNKIIAILRLVPVEKVRNVVEALYDGGIRLVEVTFDMGGRMSEDETAESISLIKNLHPDLDVGAGTVLTPGQVDMAKRSGAKFILAPNAKETVVKRAVELGMVAIPGAMTPSEVMDCIDWGADFVKIFPAGNLGEEYIKALLAPLSGVRTIAVGGINESNVSSYLHAGSVGVGIGSNIVNGQLVKSEDYDSISALARRYVMAVDGKV